MRAYLWAHAAGGLGAPWRAVVQGTVFRQVAPAALGLSKQAQVSGEQSPKCPMPSICVIVVVVRGNAKNGERSKEGGHAEHQQQRLQVGLGTLL